MFSLIGVANAHAASLSLAWDPPADAKTAGYILKVGTAPGNYSSQTNVGLVFTHRVDGLLAGTTYCFAVQAYSSTGELSELSDPVCGKTPASTEPATSTPPPTNPPPPTDPAPTNPPPSGGTAAASELVLYAAKATLIKGDWAIASNTTAAAGRSMRSTDRGWSATAAPLASPAHYFEITFDAAANTPYQVWLRLRAGAESKWNDSVWVQFSDSLVNGQSRYRSGTTSALAVNLERCADCGVLGWGWLNTAYWLNQTTTVTFAQAGKHTIRVQTREDGVEIDQIVLSPAKYMAAAPGAAANDRTILTATLPVTSDTSSPLPPSPAPTTVPEIVMHTTDARTISGNWSVAASTGAAGGRAVRSVDRGWSSPDAALASPTNYFDLQFDATANTPYRVWLRLRASGNSKWNDAVWVQFSDSLVNATARYRLGTSSGLAVNMERCGDCGVAGWGWHNTAYWLAQNTVVTFAQSGRHTLRVQIREDGVEVDQIVLSAVKYYATAPGSNTNDATILAKTTAGSVPSGGFSGSPLALPGTIEAAHFDHGANGVAYFDRTPGNSGGGLRAGDVDIEASSGGGYNVGWADAGEWLTYTVNVKATGTYTLDVRVSSVGGGTLQLSAGAPSNTSRSVTVPNTHGWQSWTTLSVPMTLVAGQQLVTVRFTTANINFRSITVR
jgi:hypothetical protein